MYKFNIGTITSDKFVNVKYLKGKSIEFRGELCFKIKSRRFFLFWWQLQHVRIRDMTLYVKKSSKKSPLIPHK